jgi:Family of unknown function (DUF5994)
MTSGHISEPDHLDAHDLATCDGSARLSLKPNTSARGALDGAWWPRSTDPAIELAGLIEELGVQRILVQGLTLSRIGWDSAPRRIRLVSGRKIAVEWFRSGDVRMIGVLDINYQRINLLVIPVDTTPAIADLALRMATDGHDPHIAATGSHHSVPGCRPVKAQASPGNDDDSPDRRSPDWASDNPPSAVVARRDVVLPPPDATEQINLPHPRSEGPRHDHGDRITTRQQLLDKQADAAKAQLTPATNACTTASTQINQGQR